MAGDQVATPAGDVVDERVTVTIDKRILQCAIEVFARGGCEYVAWIDKLPIRDAYNVALLIGVLLEADAHGRFSA
ncbi:MAG: hypothetical protein LC750_16780 [Actinobacteria bacterium]|nr:hypothetical protein [Actinomycetota bacterium]